MSPESAKEKIELRKKVMDVAQVTNRAVEACRPSIQERQQHLTVTVPKRPLWINGDAARIEQAIANLLNNATKYTQTGGQIRVHAEEDGTQAVIRIRDSGIGIDPEGLPHIFDLFVQAVRLADRSEAGFGLGLAAGVGQGSEFVIHLPCVRQTQNHTESNANFERQGAEMPPLRILVADDNVDSADCLARLLKISGHELRVAYDGPTALAVATNFQPKVVLLDIGIPGLSGYEVAQRLKETPETKNATLVAITRMGTTRGSAKVKRSWV